MTLNKPPEIAEPRIQPPAKEPLMRTSLELVDRAIEIEWATTLKPRPGTPVDQALGLLIAEWAATWGPWACTRILRIALYAIVHPVWRARAARRKRRPARTAHETATAAR